VSLLRLAQGFTKVWNNGLTHGLARNQNPPWVAPYLALKGEGTLWELMGVLLPMLQNLQQGLIRMPPTHCTGEPE
jgi:hypothetical protein